MLIRSGEPGSVLPIRPWDHPDLVLARAVAVAVIDRDEAALIAATRLDDQALAGVAAQIGISPQLASDWRAKAEKRLVEAIRACGRQITATASSIAKIARRRARPVCIRRPRAY